MRRRPSSSGEDESHVVTRGMFYGPDKPTKSRAMSRDGFRATTRPQTTTAAAATKMKGEEYRASTVETNGDVRAGTRSQWSRPALPEPALEGNELLNEPLRTKESREPTEYLRKQRAQLRGPWTCSFLTLATTACSILLLATIMRSFFTLQMDPKGCAMSYMRPAFARFADFDTEHTRFASKYSLYLYREGGVDEDTRVKGIPVIFIPGNAGSYKQVRPIAAEAARYFHDVLRNDPGAEGSGKRPLDFFTVDFNEELTAFHGQTMLDQAEYLNEAVAYILALYHNPHRSLREPGLPDPKSVIILGHSMGGIVARAMLRMPNYQDSTINTIITLSAPHARAPISFDRDMVSTYNDINTFWRDSYSALKPENNPLADITLVSVAGGGLDTMIPSEYSSLTSLVPDTHGFTVFTSAIPQVWTGMDHLAIMWCDQFRKALVRAIFDVADARRPTQTLEQGDRIRALRKRLLTGMESVVEKAALDSEPTTFLTLEEGSASILSQNERLVLRSPGHTANTKTHLLPIPAEPHSEGSKFTLMTDQELHAGEDENSKMTALLCTAFPPPGHFASALAINIKSALGAAGTTRLACKNAVADVTYLPASTNTSVNAFDQAKPFTYLQYALEDLRDFQFVAVVEQPAEANHGWLLAEFSAGNQSTMKVSKGHHQILINGLRRKLGKDRPMMTELKIPEVHSTMFAYNLRVHRDPCQKGQEELFAPLLRQSIQEPYESKYFVNTKGGNINVHGISPYMPPPLSGKGASEGLSLQLWTDPTCNSTVKVSLTVDLVGSAGKLVMRYRTVFAAFPLLVVAIVLRKQFKVYDATGVFMSFSQSMDHCIRTSIPAIIAALTFLSVALSKATQGPWARRWFSQSTGTDETSIDFTVNDLMLGTSDPFFWFLVPLFGIVSVGVCIAGNYFVLTIMETLALLYGRLRTLFLTKADEPRRPTFAMTSPHQRMITTTLLLLLVITLVPYQFAYMVLSIVQLFTCVRALRHARDSGTDGPAYNFYNYVHSMLVLMLWILPINMPVLVVWIHNLAVHWLTPFSALHNLLAVLPLILLVETMRAGGMVPRVTSRIRYLTNIALFAFALYAAVYGVTYAYRLHHLVNALCAWLFLIHLSASSSSSGSGSVPFTLSQQLLHRYLPHPRRRSHLSSTSPSSSRLEKEAEEEEGEEEAAGGQGNSGNSQRQSRGVKKRP
ncbi:GPI inositol-deacylase-like protein [Hortaea werneckii]|nr:GPI inositol-deacylase-like protein [Hortaea werneckii]